MAVLNINANSSGNISISGTSAKTGTISWTIPSLPSVATITSCTLTGKATISMTRGTGTCTVNGTSVTNGQTFTINLNSGVSSVSVSCKGSNNQARGTVSFSNLVYTVNYTIDYSSLNHIATYKFNNTMYDLIPYFEDGFNYGYVCDDTVEGNTTTRRLYSEALPQYMCFGNGEGSDDRTNSLYEIDYLNTSNLVSMYCMFADCTNLYAINDCNWDTRNVINMCAMFYNCTGLTSLDLTSWDVSNVEDMSWMFENCYDLQTLNLANWDTGSVTTMEGMFVKDVHLISVDTTNWDTSNVIDMSYMFGKANYGEAYPGCDSLEEIIGIEDWDVSNVTDMSEMFYGAYKLKSLDLNKWDTSNVIDMGLMFCAAGYENPDFSLNINMWDVSNVESMAYMFDCCPTLKELDLSGWDVSNVRYMEWMFGNDAYDDTMQLTKLNLSGWTFNDTVDMSNIFSYTNSLNEIIMNSDISSINKIIEVLPTRSMDDKGLIDVSGISSEQFHDINYVLSDSKGWDIIFGKKIAEYKFDTSIFNDSTPVPEVNEGLMLSWREVREGTVVTITLYAEESPGYMIFGTSSGSNKADSLLEVSYLDMDKVYTMSEMFRNCSNLTNVSINVTNKVTTLYSSFYNCHSLVSLDVSNWDVSNVIDMRYIFRGCTSLANLIGIESWNTNNLTNGADMFAECHNLTSLDLSKWGTGNLSTMYDMFWDCTSLKTLDVSGVNVNSVINLDWTFSDCISLETLKLNGWKINDTIADGDINEIFAAYNYSGNTKLKTIEMINSDYKSINKIIQYLPTRSANSYGTIYIYGVDSIDKVNTTTANSKYWNISNVAIEDNSKLMMEYTFDKSIYDLIPYTSGFTYHYKDTVDDNNANIITRKVYSYNPLRYVRFGKMNDGIDEPTNQTRSLLTIEYLDTSNLSDMGYLFSYCTNLNYVNTSNWDVSNVNSLYYTFAYCKSLTNLDVSNWDIRNVNSLYYTFAYCYSLTTIDVSNWDVSNVTNMSATFYYCDSLTNLNVSNWDVSNVTYMNYMFSYCKSLSMLKGVENWDVSNVTNMTELFYHCKFGELNLSNWDVSNVTNMRWMFGDCYMLRTLDVTGWDTRNVTNMYAMFGHDYVDDADDLYGCRRLVKIKGIEDWDVSNVIDMGEMFNGCKSIESLNLSKWKTSSLGKFDVPSLSSYYDLYCTFWECTSLKELDLSNWDVSNVTRLDWIFCDCISLETLKLNGWHLNKATIFHDLFALYEYTGCPNLKTVEMNNSDYSSVNKIISELPTRTENNPGDFYVVGIDNLAQVDTNTANSKYWNIMSRSLMVQYKFNNSITSNLLPVFNAEFTNYEVVDDNIEGNMVTRSIYNDIFPTSISFEGQTSLNEVLSIDTRNMTSAYNLFYNCTNLTYVNFRNSDFSKMTTIERMFTYCSNLVEIDGLNELDVSNVDNMGGIFSDCSKIQKLDVRDWDVSKVTNFGAVFRRCSLLTKLDVSRWNTSNGVIMSGIFTNCSGLTQLDVSNWTAINATSISQLFYGCSNLTTLKMFKTINSEAVTTYLFGNCKSLDNIEMVNSDHVSVNKVISELYDRSKSATVGTLNIFNVDNYGAVDIDTAINKKWSIAQEVPQAKSYIFVGGNNIIDIFVGYSTVEKIYLGDLLLYSR